MSERLPVGETINEAFRFGLHRWGSLIRFGWFPTLVSIAVMAAYLGVVLDFNAMPKDEAEFQSFDQLGDIFRFSIPITVILGLGAYALIYLAFAGAAASVFRLAALGEERPGFLHLRFDGPAKRVFFAFFVLGLINLVVWGGAFTAGLSLAGSSWGDLGSAFMRFMEIAAEAETTEPTPEDFEGLGAPLQAFGWALLIAAVPAFYIGIKLVPFVAGSAAENRLILFGSFRMTTGHFWSIFGLYVLVLLVTVLTSSVFEIVGQIITMLGSFLMMQGAVMGIVGGALFFLYFVAAVWYYAFIYAFQLGMQGIIYRRLKTGS